MPRQMFRRGSRRIARHLPVCAIALLTAASARAQLVADPAAAVAGIDAEVKREMEQLHVPGVAVGVIVDGKVILAKGYGVRDIDKPDLVDADTIFDIGSMSKSFTATAVAAMVDDGKLAWDTPVVNYLPWFRMYDPVTTQLLTPRDMLAHRSGLTRHDFLRHSTYMSREELVRRLRYLEPGYSFRDGFHYNNLVYTAAGYLAGVEAGMSWEDLVKQRIFTPLGMTHSNTSAVELQHSNNFAHPHNYRDGKIFKTEVYDYQKFGVGPNGAVNSCVDDMLKYLAFHLADGRSDGKQVISIAQMKELHKPANVDGQGTYALGWEIYHHRGHRIIEHDGGITGFGSDMAMLPDEKTGIVVLHNQETDLPDMIVKVLMDRLLGLPAEDYLAESLAKHDSYKAVEDAAQAKFDSARIPGAKPTLPISAYTGAYYHPAYGTIHIDRKGDDGLVAKFDAWNLNLKPYNYDDFSFWGTDLAQFHLNEFGKVSEVLLQLEDDVKPFVFVKQDR